MTRFQIALSLVICTACLTTAAPVTWTLRNVVFSDKGVATGSFVHDADTGSITNWNISTTGGNTAVFFPFNFTPANSTAAFYTATGGFNFFSTALFPAEGDENLLFQLVPVSPLTDAGGAVNINVQSQNSDECFDCYPSRSFVSGFVTTRTTVTPVTTGPVYWSATPPDCTGVEVGPTITTPSGETGYTCEVSGTFVWLAAGGPPKSAWSSAIRVAAPASNAIDAAYLFYDMGGKNLSLDTTLGSGSAVTSGDEVQVALSPNQPLEVDLLGATSNAPSYSTTQTGSVYAQFYCPDAVTCSDVLPQLLYSALPAIPWSLSVPIAWDDQLSNQWSAEGIDDGGTHRVSFAVYNQGATATSFRVRVYDSNGNLFGTGITPLLLPYQSTGEAETYGALLSQVVSPLPSGVFKVVFDGGSEASSVEVLQITGASATTVQVGRDSSSGGSLDALSPARPRSSEHVVGTVPR
jgi:hypothetical protein